MTQYHIITNNSPPINIYGCYIYESDNIDGQRSLCVCESTNIKDAEQIIFDHLYNIFEKTEINVFTKKMIEATNAMINTEYILKKSKVFLLKENITDEINYILIKSQVILASFQPPEFLRDTICLNKTSIMENLPKMQQYKCDNHHYTHSSFLTNPIPSDSYSCSPYAKEFYTEYEYNHYPHIYDIAGST